MAVKDYGFSEDLIAETTIIDKDKHGFIRQTVKDMDIQGDDVIFIDYDGTVLHSYNADAFLKMSSMPKNPEHDGLISRGWNWSFEDAQAYVQKYGMLVIGPMYAPEDHATHMFIQVDQDLLTVVPLCFSQTVPNGVKINWGDGSEIESVDEIGVVTISHDYQVSGNYEIVIKIEDDCVALYGDLTNRISIFNDDAIIATTLKHLILSDKIALVGSSPFRQNIMLETVVLPYNIESIPDNYFNGSYSLKALIIPNQVESIGQLALTTCHRMEYISLPCGLNNIGMYTMSQSIALLYLSLPENITVIKQMSFNYCYNLTRLVIPDGITAIENNAFTECQQLRQLYLPDSIISLGTNNFSSLWSLTDLKLPKNIETIPDGSFSGTYLLRNINIPDHVTTIGEEDIFGFGKVPQTIYIPESVTSIGNKSFRHIGILLGLYLMSETPPTIDYQTFMGLPANGTIYVPYSEDHSTLNAYKSAQYWSAFADRMIEMDAN